MTAPGPRRDVPEPGETRRTLERPPGDRYDDAERRPTAGASPRLPATGRAALVALAGAVVMTIAGGLLSMTLGLVVVIAFTAWLIASIVRPQVWRAIGLAVGSVAAGLVGIWLYAGLEGGTLGLLDYLGQVHGPLVLVEIAVAALVAFVTIR